MIEQCNSVHCFEAGLLPCCSLGVAFRNVWAMLLESRLREKKKMGRRKQGRKEEGRREGRSAGRREGEKQGRKRYRSYHMRTNTLDYS